MLSFGNFRSIFDLSLRKSTVSALFLDKSIDSTFLSKDFFTFTRVASVSETPVLISSARLRDFPLHIC